MSISVSSYKHCACRNPLILTHLLVTAMVSMNHKSRATQTQAAQDHMSFIPARWPPMITPLVVASDSRVPLETKTLHLQRELLSMKARLSSVAPVTGPHTAPGELHKNPYSGGYCTQGTAVPILSHCKKHPPNKTAWPSDAQVLHLPECVRCEAASSRKNACFRDPKYLSQSHCTATNHLWDLGVTNSYLL